MADPNEKIVQIIIGTAQELAKGKGRTACTATEAAARLRVSERTLRYLIADGIIAPAARVLNADLFDTAQVEALREQRAKPRG